jgi:hypothetical protein
MWAGLVMVVMITSVARAQLCAGTPRSSAIAYEYGKLTVGNTHGINATLGGGRNSLALTYRMRDLEGDARGQEVRLRYSLGFGAGPVQICPGLGLGFARDKWDAQNNFTLHTNSLSGRAGVGIGLEKAIYRGFALIPFVLAQYEFTAIEFDLDAPPGTETDISGDTLSRADIEYGLLAHYKFLYGGLAAQRNSDRSGNRPYMARWIVGFTFSSGGSTTKSSRAQ